MKNYELYEVLYQYFRNNILFVKYYPFYKKLLEKFYL
jgi:hypothetical protein